MHTLPLFTAAILVFLRCGDLSLFLYLSHTVQSAPRGLQHLGRGVGGVTIATRTCQGQRSRARRSKWGSIGAFPAESTRIHNICFTSRRGNHHFYLINPSQVFVWYELLNQKTCLHTNALTWLTQSSRFQNVSLSLLCRSKEFRELFLCSFTSRLHFCKHLILEHESTLSLWARLPVH